MLLLLFTVSSIAVTLDDNSLTAVPSAFLFKLVLVVSKLFSKAVIEFVVELTLPSRTSTLLARSSKAEEEALLLRSCIVLSNLVDNSETLESLSALTCSKVTNLPSELPTLVVRDVTTEAKAESPSALAFSSRAILASVVSLLDV